MSMATTKRKAPKYPISDTSQGGDESHTHKQHSVKIRGSEGKQQGHFAQWDCEVNFQKRCLCLGLQTITRSWNKISSLFLCV